MRRALAVVAAVVMIGAALVIRSRLDAGETAAQAEADRATVICATELAPVCEQVRRDHPELTITVEDAVVTAERLSKPGTAPDGTGVDAWLVPRPFPAMVEENRSFAGAEPILGDPSGVLARSPLTITIWNDKLAALGTTCGGEVDWACIGDHAGQPWSDLGGEPSWGKLKPGFPNPATAGIGLLVLAQGTGDQLGRTDYAANDLADPTYQSWLAQLKGGVPTFTPSSGSALTQMLSQGPSSFDLAGAAEAQAGPAVATSRDNQRLTVLYPSPVVTADVVLAPLRASASGGHAREVFESDGAATALAANGWRVPGQPSPTGVRTDPLPDSDGLPKPGVVQALHDAWMTT